MSKSTKTSKFGASKRENHNSDYFYSSQMYSEIIPSSTLTSDGIINPLPSDIRNRIILGDSRDLSIIPDRSIHLVITSPPYNSRKEYDEDLSFTEYLSLIEDVATEVFPKLVDGGRFALNIANLGRKPYIPVSDYISQIMTKIGYMQRGEIIWNKGASAGSSTAWGSWKSASNPCLRDVHEYILIFSKGTMKRNKKEKQSTISRDEFIEYTKSIWDFSTVSARKIGHPAPFPVELPYRCIQLYTFEGDVILDPFMGAGTTAIAALKTNRSFIGLDISEEYVNLANTRIQEYLKKHQNISKS
ncbi:MAG: site-specific DNA-methyltransferase [Candidatus Heimdallarchaeota archaeon]|nr:site-specific DNA-methyltransferase [Candidatus Heimdallarchaeota archaeon]